VSTTIQDAGRQVALDLIRVPENVRALDPEHVKALAGSISLQGVLVPVVVRQDGDGFELVAGFHRIAAARALGLSSLPVVVRDVETEAADRAVENITSCRRRHEVINSDRVVMPMSELKCPTVRSEPGGEVGIRSRTDPGSQAEAADLAEAGPRFDSESERAIGSQRHARVSSAAAACVSIRDTRALRPEGEWLATAQTTHRSASLRAGRLAWCARATSSGTR
jgi:hypothetical protein